MARSSEISKRTDLQTNIPDISPAVPERTINERDEVYSSIRRIELRHEQGSNTKAALRMDPNISRKIETI